MDIELSRNYVGEYVAIDRAENESRGGQDGYFRTDVVGYGKTPLDAIVDLLDKKEDQ